MLFFRDIVSADALYTCAFISSPATIVFVVIFIFGRTGTSLLRGLLSGGGGRASCPAACWIFPDQGSNAKSPALAGGFLAAGPLARPSCRCCDERRQKHEHEERGQSVQPCTRSFLWKGEAVFWSQRTDTELPLSKHQRSEVPLNSCRVLLLPGRAAPLEEQKPPEPEAGGSTSGTVPMSCFWLSED